MNPLPTTRENGSRRRAGFTLVELLVVIGVLIVLTTMTLSMVNITQDEDRVRAGAAQVQSYLEGARDRAIHAGEPRGVRFIRDPQNPNVATSLLYIGAPEVYGEGQSAVVLPYDFDTSGQPTKWHVRPSSNSELAVWRNFHDRGLISNGSPIQIEGQFYTIVRIQTGNRDFFRLTKDFSGSKTSGLKYRLFLNPTVLPNQEPRELPRNVVIDLNHGQLPDAWNTGTLDVLFSPNGTVTGLVASAGVIHLYLADQPDVDLGFAPGQQQQNVSGENIPREGDERYVSLRTQTGNISVHNVDITDNNGDGDADDPRRYAAQGVPAQ